MAAAPGKPSALNPKLGMTYKRSMKIERIARLSADPAQYSNEQIANMMQCTPQTVVLIRQLPAYHAKMIEIASGVVSAYDAQLRQSVENFREELRDMVPSSMMVIRNAICGKYGPQLQFKAATEVLDREGTNAKVSKSSVSVEVKPNIEVDPIIANNLMALLGGAPTRSDAEIAAAHGSDFTKTAAAAGIQQYEMATDNTKETLEKLDLSLQKPN